MLNIATAGPRGGTLSILDGGGGPTELHITNPRKYRAWNLTPKKIPGIKISYPNKKNWFILSNKEKNRFEICQPKKIPGVFLDPKKYRESKCSTQKKIRRTPRHVNFEYPPLGRRQSSVALECPRKWSFPREARSSEANSLEENTMAAFRRPRFGNVKYYMAVRNDRIRF